MDKMTSVKNEKWFKAMMAIVVVFAAIQIAKYGYAFGQYLFKTFN